MPHSDPKHDPSLHSLRRSSPDLSSKTPFTQRQLQEMDENLVRLMELANKDSIRRAEQRRSSRKEEIRRARRTIPVMSSEEAEAWIAKREFIEEVGDPYQSYRLTDKGYDQVELIRENLDVVFTHADPPRMAFATILVGLDQGITVSQVYNATKKRGIRKETFQEALASAVQHGYIVEVLD